MNPAKQAPRTLRADASRALASDLGWHARLAARLITGELDQGLAASGLSSTQFALMCLIAAAPDDTLGALARDAGLNQSTMSRNVDMLAKAGLVEVVTVEQDRRQRAVWLTEAGARKLRDAIPLWRSAHKSLTSRFGPALSDRLVEASAILAPLQPD